MKKFNRQIKTHPVVDYAEKTEMENLFMECVNVSQAELQKKVIFEKNFG